MSAKKALLANFFQNHSRLPKPSSDPPQPVTPSPAPRSHSSKNLNSQKTPSRSSSSCSLKQTASSPTPQSLPLTYKAALSKLTTKKILNLPPQPTDENTIWLLYTFLALLSLADKQGSASAAQNRSKATRIFREYTKNPGKLILFIRKIPSQIQSQQLSAGFVTKLEASFKLVNSSLLTDFLEIYEIVNESLSFLRSLPKYSSLKPEITPIKKASNFVIKKHFLTKSPLPVSLTSKFLNTSEKSNSSLNLSKSATKTQVVKNMKSCLNTQDFSLNRLRNRSVENGIVNKTEKFMAESRVNKRLQERMMKFLKEKAKGEKLGVEGEEVGRMLVEEFTAGMKCSEISAGSEKFLEYFRRSQEFEKEVRRIMDR